MRTLALDDPNGVAIVWDRKSASKKTERFLGVLKDTSLFG